MSLPTLRVGRARRACTRSRTGGPPSRTSSGRAISMAMNLGVSSRPSTRPLITDDRVVVEQLAVLRIVFGNTITSIAAARSSSTNVGHQVALLGELALQAGDDAADRRASRRRRSSRELGERARRCGAAARASAPISGWSLT